MDAVTHVLEWMPPWLSEDGGDLGWELQTYADWAAGTPKGTWWPSDLPEDADAALLAEWAEGQLGFPVTLTKDAQGIKKLPGRRLQRWHTVPIYFVERRS